MPQEHRFDDKKTVREELKSAVGGGRQEGADPPGWTRYMSPTYAEPDAEVDFDKLITEQVKLAVIIQAHPRCPQSEQPTERNWNRCGRRSNAKDRQSKGKARLARVAEINNVE